MIHGIRTVGPDLHLEDGILPFAGNGLHGDACGSQIVGELTIVDFEVGKFAHPLGSGRRTVNIGGERSVVTPKERRTPWLILILRQSVSCRASTFSHCTT